MKNILVCWELGEDLGHLTNFLPLIKHITQQGFHCYLTVRNLQKAAQLEWPEGTFFLQAPLHPLNAPPPPTYSFADILMHRGYKNLDELKPLIEAWQLLLDLVKPVALIFDHSPTALLAYRHIRLPKFIYSIGFLTPAVDGVDLNLRSGMPLEPIHQAARDKLLTLVNQYLLSSGQLPISTLGEIYSVTETAIIGYPLIDMYKDYRKQESYIASVEQNFGFDLPEWTSNADDIYVFAYLKSKAKQSEAVLSCLKQLNIRGLCYYSGISELEAKRMSNATMQVTHSPVSIPQVMNRASVVICHAGQGLVNDAIVRGKPLILVPTQLEQGWTTSVLTKKRVAIGIYREDTEEQILQKIRDFFSTNQYHEFAQLLTTETKPTETIADFANSIIQTLSTSR